jgi:cytochrome oxidase assembly protein ShyY1
VVYGAAPSASRRVLATPRWFALAALAVLLAAIMVELGIWQLHRYHQRSAVNARIDASASAQPVPLAQALAGPDGAQRVGPAPPAGVDWTRVSATGEYDSGHEILVRGRTLDGAVGFEVLTPLVLPDGAAVLVDRGWVPAAPGGASAIPDVPVAPGGQVTVVGALRVAESRSDAAVRRGDRIEVRRIDPARVAPVVPYPLYGGYVALDTQVPPAAAGLTRIPPEHQNALQNAGYVVQWWCFAALTLVGFGYLARREVQQAAEPARDPALAR